MKSLNVRVQRWLDAHAATKSFEQVALGIIPLPPSDRIAILYEGSRLQDVAASERCIEALNNLERREVQIALQASDLSSGVIDFIIQLYIHDDDIVLQGLDHPELHDQTFAFCAQQSNSKAVVERLAEKHEKLLKHPEVAQCLINKNMLPMGVIQLLCSLIPGLQIGTPVETPVSSHTDKVHEEVNGAEEPDFKSMDAEEVARFDRRVRNLRKEIPTLTMGQKLALAMKGNKETREILISQPQLIVQKAVLSNPQITEEEVLSLASDRGTAGDLLRMIALNREWMKSAEIKIALVKNPKSPIGIVLPFLAGLGNHELTTISRSKNIASAIVKQAETILKARGQKKAE